MPQLCPEAVALLDKKIFIEEIIQAIKESPDNKTSGPDGFTAEFYKCFCKELDPLLLRMFKHAAAKGRLPQTLYTANISLILKKGRDALQASSYSPVSLIPNETKLISKILANCLKTYIHAILHPDAQKAFDQVKWPYMYETLALGRYS